jgi:hypothetical protein
VLQERQGVDQNIVSRYGPLWTKVHWRKKSYFSIDSILTKQIAFITKNIENENMAYALSQRKSAKIKSISTET